MSGPHLAVIPPTHTVAERDLSFPQLFVDEYEDMADRNQAGLTE